MRFARLLRVSLVFAASLCALLAVTAPARAADAGALRLVPGDQGCFQNVFDGVNCTDAHGLGRAATVRLSSDGKYAYVVGVGGSRESLAVFQRQTTGPNTGKLAYLTCFNENATDGCSKARGMTDPYSVASRGDFVYVMSHYGYESGVAIFQWGMSGGTPTLSQVAGPDGCVVGYTPYIPAGDNCTEGRDSLYYQEDIAISPDGKSLYTVGDQYVNIFTRDQSTGLITQAQDETGCLAGFSGNGCTDVRQLDLATSLAFAGDSSLYVSAHNGHAVVELTRNPATGALSQPAGYDGCVDQQGEEGCLDGRGLQGARELVVSPDGTNVYVASRDSDGVAILNRRADGSLRQAKDDTACVTVNGRDPEGSTEYRCGVGRGLEDATALAISPDGASLYVRGGYDNAIAAFRRDDDGLLHRLAGADDCTTDSGDLPFYYYYYEQRGVCQATANDAELLDSNYGHGIAISPDGANAYVAASDATSTATQAGLNSDGALSIFTRTAVPAATAPDRLVWDAGEDFRTGARRGEDDYGNSNVWDYEVYDVDPDDGDASDRDPSDYDVLTQESAHNITRPSGYPDFASRGRGELHVHPANTDSAVLRWRNPTGQNLTVAVSLQLSDADACCYDGVAWYLDTGTDTALTSTPASGDIPNGDDADRFEGNVDVAAGESLYLVVAPKDNYNYDSTQVDFRISAAQNGGPQTVITSAPKGKITTRTPSFSFTATNSSGGFKCETHKVGQPSGTFASCTSPFTPTLPSDGDWVFRVKANDGAQDDPTPARRRFSVDSTGPIASITAGPGAATRDTTPRFEFEISEPGFIECRLDGAAFARCTSPQDYANLSEDVPHTFQVRGTDQLGNVGPIASRTFTISTSPDGTQPGALSQLSGTNGCLSYTPYSDQGCATARRTSDAIGSAVSPDGLQLYEVSFEDDSLSVYDRNPTTGALTQRAGAAGCFTRDGDASCTNGIAALDNPDALAVTADEVYVAGYYSDSIATFHRSSGGGLTYAGCIGPASAGCATQARRLDGPAQVVVSSDGSHVYAVNEDSDAITVFDAAGGTLTQKAGAEGCYANVPTGGDCRDARALQNPVDIAISPDGADLYAGSSESHSVTAFAVKGDGRLRQLTGEDGCIRETPGEDCRDGRALTYARGVVVSPDGRQVYASTDNGVAVLDRDGRGALSQSDDNDGCLWNAQTPDCRLMRAGDLQGMAIVISPDGRNLYGMDGFTESMVSIRRDADGDLRQLAGRDACYSETGNNGTCADGRGLRGYYGSDGISMSPDGRNVYFTGRDFPGTIAVFRRATTPAFSQSPPLEWDAYVDFDPADPGQNPSPDRYGNAGVWRYLKIAADNDASDRFTSTYSDLPRFATSGPNRRSGWFDNGGSGWLGAGQYYYDDRWFVHPEQNSDGHESVATRWTAPLAGTHSYRVQGLVDHYTSCGDGVRWYVDRRSPGGVRTEVLSGTSGLYAKAQPIEETLSVAAGESLEFVLAPRSDYGCDSTVFDIHITSADTAEAGPQTVLGDAPRRLTNDDTPHVAYSSSTGGATFECSVDGAAFASCPSSSGYDLAHLADGAHTFAVRAVNGGTPDQTPARTSFTVDTAPPTVTIVSGPTGVTRDASSVFAFSSTEPGVIECRIDQIGAADPDSWQSCGSPYTTPELGDGAHDLEVRSLDRAHNASSLKTRHFIVDTGAATLQPGALAQLPGTRGCVSQSAAIENCTAGRAMDGLSQVAFDTDGVGDDDKFAYAASYDSDSLTVYQRTPSGGPGAGDLTPVAGTGGCVTHAPTADCATGRFMNGAYQVAVYGDNVYVAAYDNLSLDVFTRNQADGTVTQMSGPKGCLRHHSDEGGQCTDVRALYRPTSVAVAPDGKQVYVSSWDDGGYIAVFDRDPSDGSLSQPAGEDACFSYDGRDGCRDGRGLYYMQTLVATNDEVYAASFYGEAVLSLKRDAQGRLSQPAGEAGCIQSTGAENCADGPGLYRVNGLAVAPDGSTVYATTDYEDAVYPLEVQPDGGLRAIDFPDGCQRNDGNFGCDHADALSDPTGVIVSRDGQSVYVQTASDNSVAAFRRNPDTGALKQLSGADACISQTGTGGRCRDGKALDSTSLGGLVESPDGTNVYVASRESDAIASLARRKPNAATAPADMVWDAGPDFLRAPDQANPQPDRYGNAGVWSYRQDETANATGSDRAPGAGNGNYPLLTTYRTDDPFGFAYPDHYWARADGVAGRPRFPFIGQSRFGRLTVHPDSDGHLANNVVGWRNPLSTSISVNVSGEFDDVDKSGNGDGIVWYVDHGTDNLRTGTMSPGGSQSFDLTETVAPGDYLWFYVARNGSDNNDGTYVDVTISGLDEPGPQTRITGGPRSVTTNQQPTFTFVSSQSGSTFECKLDGGAWTACDSGSFTPASALADGTHKLRVRATKSGVTDPSPAVRTFRVDTTASAVSIEAGPDGLTRDRTPTYEFSKVTEEDGSFLECKVDSGDWTRCVSPFTLPELSNGDHTFSVRVTDRAGNHGPVQTVAITVDLSPAGLQFGGLTQLPGLDGCTSETGTDGACRDGQGLATAATTAITPNGKFVYTGAADADTIDVFSRAAGGALTFASCVNDSGSDGCANGVRTDRIEDLVVDPTGKFLYASARNGEAVLVFSIDPTTGALTQLPGAMGCFATTAGEGCGTAPGMYRPWAIEIGPDGRLYVVSYDNWAVTVLDRDPATGALSFNSCVSDSGSGPCAAARQVTYPTSIQFAGDDVYVGGYHNGSIAVFKRQSGGTLTQPAGTAGCVRDVDFGDSSCAQARRLRYVDDMAMSPDGAQLYVADTYYDAIAILKRNAATGALTQSSTAAGCWNNAGGNATGEDGGCESARGLVDVEGIAVAPDGKSLYTLSATDNALSIFKRNPTTGTLQQLSGVDGCWSNTGSGNACRDAKALDTHGEHSIVVSPDNANVYTANWDSGSIASFSRRVPRRDDQPPLREWNLAEDFDTTAGATNPQQDRQGGTGVWSYMRGNGAPDGSGRDPSAYTLFTDKQTDAGGWRQRWYHVGAGDQSEYPYVGLNRTRRVIAHPDNGSGRPAVVRWTYPFAESTSLDVSLKLDNSSCGGDGTRYVLEKVAAGGAATVLRSGRVANNAIPIQIDRSVAISTGDRLDLVITNRTGNYGCDGTTIDWNMTSGPVVDTAFAPSSPDNNAVINDRTPTYTAVSEDGATFFCRVTAGTTGSGPYTPCPTGEYTPGPLADGTYTVEAYARVGGTDDPTPAKRTVIIDGTAPAPTVTSPADGGSTNNTSPTFSGTAGDQVLSSSAGADNGTVTVKLWQGTDTSGAPFRTISNVSRTGGAWSTPLTGGALAEGRYTVKVSQEDQAGNVGTSPGNLFHVDTTKPVITISSPASQQDLNQGRPTITGNAGHNPGGNDSDPSRDDDTITLRIYTGTSTATKVAEWTATRAENGDFSTQMPGSITALADGRYNVRVTQGDAAGNSETFPSNGRTFKVDTVAPVVSITSPPATTADRKPAVFGTAAFADGTGSNVSADSATVTLNVYSGTTVTGALVQSVGGTRDAAGSIFAADGTSTLRPTSNLADGTYTAQVEQLDAAGNVGRSNTRTFKVDNTGPSISITGPPADTNDATPDVTGSGGTKTGSEPDAVADDATVDIDVTRVSTGALVQHIDDAPRALGVTLATLPADGRYTVTVRQDDALGNHTDQSRTFRLDRTVPETLTITAPNENAELQSTPSFAGKASTQDGSADPQSADSDTVTLRIYDGPDTTGTEVRTLSATRTGDDWAITVTPALPAGRYTGRAEQLDAAGNKKLSNERHFKIDNTPPAPTIATEGGRTEFDETLVKLSGVGGTNTATDVQSADLDPITVKVYAGSVISGSPVQSPTANRGPGGAYSVTLASLAPGRYIAAAFQSDGAGNTTLTPNTVQFRVDKTDPALTVTTPAEKQAFQTQTPAFSGDKGNEDGNANTQSVDDDTVSLHITGPGTDLTFSSPAQDAATWSATVPTPLAQGYYTLAVTQADAAGNSVTTSDRHFKIDRTAPVATVQDPGGDIKVSPTLSGSAGVNPGTNPDSQSADDAAVTVRLYRITGASTRTIVPGYPKSPSVTAGGSWTVASGLATDGSDDGRYEVEVSQGDAVGNTATSSPEAFRLDTKAPAITLTAPEGDTNNRKPHLVGTRGTNPGGATDDTSADQPAITVGVKRGATVILPTQSVATGPGGSFDVEVPTTGAGLAAGTYEVTITQLDDAGNSSASEAKTFRVDPVAPVGLATEAPAENADVKQSRPAFAGNAANNGSTEDTSPDGDVTIEIYEPAAAPGVDAPLRTFSGGHTATFSIALPAGQAELPEGSYKWRAIQSDAAGNRSATPSSAFRVDTTAPAPTATTPTAPYSGTRTPAISGDRGAATGDLKPITVVLTGPGATQTLTDNGSGATWTVTPAALDDGEWTATVKQSDRATNESAVVRTFRVDATAPAVTTAVIPPSNAVNGPVITGTAGDNAATASHSADDQTVPVAITPATSGLADPPDLVGQRGTTVGTTTLWSATFSSPLPEGRYRATASQGDGATPPNVGTALVREFVIDRQAPTPSITAPAAGARRDRTFNVEATLGQLGDAERATDVQSATVEVYAGDVPVTTTDTPVFTASGSATGGAVSIPVTIPAGSDGQYTLVLDQADTAGNHGRVRRVVVVDATNPVVTISSPTEGEYRKVDVSNATGTKGRVAASSTSSADSDTVTVKIYRDAALTDLADTQTDTSTGPTWSITTAALAEGTYYMVASQDDGAGNTGRSATRTFHVDLTDPAPAISTPADGAFTNDTTPTVTVSRGTATGDIPAVTVTASRSGETARTCTVAAGDSSCDLPALTEGDWTLTASQSDQSGRTGTSAPRTLHVDLTAPALTLTQVCNPCNSLTSLSGQRGKAAGDLDPVSVAIDGGTPTVDSGTGSSWGVAVSLSDGSHGIVVTQVDRAGNAATVSRTAVLDTQAPAPTVTDPTGDIKIKQPVLKGTAGSAPRDEATVDVHLKLVGGATTDFDDVPVSSGTWQYALTSDLADGQYEVTVTQADSAGNSATSAKREFRVDTAAPVVTLDAVADPTNDSTPEFTGTNSAAVGNGVPSADGPVTIDVYAGTTVGATPVQTVTATRTGNAYSGTATTLADGTYTAVARQSDAAGNAAVSTARTFRVDTAAPDLSVVSPASGTQTNDSTPTVTISRGTVATGDLPPVTVTFTRNGVDRTCTIAAADTSCDAPALTDGTWSFTAAQSDSAGNTKTTAARTITIDTAAPQLSVTVPADNAFVTATPTIGGTTDDTAVVHVILTQGATTRTLDATPSAGTWSVSVPAGSPLAEGTWSYVASQTDGAGNVASTASRTLRVDTVAPAVTLIAPADGAVTSNRRPAFSGTLSTGAGDVTAVTVELSGPNGATRTLDADETGANWTATPATDLAEGTWTATAKQSDQAGNTGSSVTITFTVDATPPALSITAPADGAATKDTTPSVTVSRGTATGDLAPVTVTATRGGESDRTCSIGAGASTCDLPALTEGTWSITASQSDSAGNVRTTATVTLLIDTTAPAVTITGPPARTNDSTPTIAGTAGAGARDGKVRVLISSSQPDIVENGIAVVNDGTWSYTAPALADGDYVAHVTQTDDAGNVSTEATRAFTVDTAAPSVSIVSPADGDYTKETSQQVTIGRGGAAGDLAPVTVTATKGAVTRICTASGTDTTCTVDQLTEGDWTITASQSDSAGNTRTTGGRTLHVDLTAPAAPGVDKPVDNARTNDATPEVSGTVTSAPGDVGRIKVNFHWDHGPDTDLDVDVNGGTFSGAPAASLADGTYTITITRRDQAGNVSSPVTRTVTVDTAKPAVTLAQVPARTKNPRPAFSGTASTGAGDAGKVTVDVATSEPGGGPHVRFDAQVGAGGAWSASPPADLADGPFTVTVSQDDSAGNTDTSASQPFVVDTAAPAVSISSPADGATATTASQEVTVARGTATGDLPPVTVTATKGSAQLTCTAAAGADACTITGLSNGDWSLTASQADDLGNTATTAARALKVQIGGVVTPTPTPTATPTVTVSPTATPTASPGAKPQFVSVKLPKRKSKAGKQFLKTGKLKFFAQLDAPAQLTYQLTVSEKTAKPVKNVVRYEAYVKGLFGSSKTATLPTFSRGYKTAKFSKKALRKLRSLGRVRMTLVLTATNSAGTTAKTAGYDLKKSVKV